MYLVMLMCQDASEVEENWEQLKIKENNGYKPVLSGVPSSLPAIIKANRIQEKVRGVGFDWEKREQIWDKVLEEIHELKEEINNSDKVKLNQNWVMSFSQL